MGKIYVKKCQKTKVSWKPSGVEIEEIGGQIDTPEEANIKTWKIILLIVENQYSQIRLILKKLTWIA